jgi:serine/threonine protein kinase
VPSCRLGERAQAAGETYRFPTITVEAFTDQDRSFVRGEVPSGDNRGRVFTVAQPLAGRYEIGGFFAAGGTGLLLEGRDLRTGGRVLLKSVLRYDIAAYARYADRDGFTNQLRAPRKTLEVERRILVMLRNAGCNAVPHPNDFVFDRNPLLCGPHAAEEGPPWTYDDQAMIDAEPYLVMEAVEGTSLEQVLADAPDHRLSEERALRILRQVSGVLALLHQPRELRAGMIWRLIYQDLKPGNILVGAHDRVTVLDLGGCQLVNLATGQKLLQGACTPAYCPPECERPFEHLSPAADVYTVGSTLFHLLSGRNPMEFLPAGLALNQARAVRLDTAILSDLCRTQTRRLIERCLADDPAARYADMGELRRALEETLAT